MKVKTFFVPSRGFEEVNFSTNLDFFFNRFVSLRSRLFRMRLWIIGFIINGDRGYGLNLFSTLFIASVSSISSTLESSSISSLSLIGCSIKLKSGVSLRLLNTGVSMSS